VGDPDPGHKQPPDPGAPDAGTAPGTPPPPGAEGPVALCLVVATVAALALAGVYVAGGQPQAEGALLFVSLGALGVALVLWGIRLLPPGDVVGERGELASGVDERAATEATLDADAELFARRRSLLRLLGAAGGALGLAALFPVRSLGPSPGRSLFETGWTAGRRVVDQQGRPVRVERLAVGGVLTVFPEGQELVADSQAVLIRVEPRLLRLPPGREGWSTEGYVCYSKICTHVGCPVGLYQTATHELLCPCHQSTFNVLDGARPRFGPATRPLPQLPLGVDRDGFLVATADFDEPVGPGFWNRDR
jgi:ubiquinol-cytochrome c reductase iron-sulfur subunit